MAKISVIVPVYKVEPYLRQCVDSILGQTFTDFELILVDDGSPDKCGEMCDEYARRDSRVHVIHQENGGLSAARNTGIEFVLGQSNAQYISFIDSDDVIASDYFECLLSGMNDTVDISCVKPMIAPDFSDGVFCEEAVGWRYIDPEEYWCDLARFPMSAWGKLYRKSLFADIRYPVGKIHEDEFVTHLVLFNRPKIAFMDEYKYGYRSRSGSIMNDGWSERNLVRIDALKNQIKYFRQLGFVKAEKKAAERLCSQDFIRAISLLNRHEYLDELSSMTRAYYLPILNFLDVYKVLYPKTYKIRWYWARVINGIRRDGLMGMGKKVFFRILAKNPRKKTGVEHLKNLVANKTT